jgi:hypothetical protein
MEASQEPNAGVAGKKEEKSMRTTLSSQHRRYTFSLLFVPFFKTCKREQRTIQDDSKREAFAGLPGP